MEKMVSLPTSTLLTCRGGVTSVRTLADGIAIEVPLRAQMIIHECAWLYCISDNSPNVQVDSSSI